MATVENHLIERLSRKDRMHLLALCTPVEMRLAEVLCEPGEPTRHGYFPAEGYISLVAMHERKPSLEVGMVGREGMLGEQLVLGVMLAPLHAIVQGPGTAWRISAAIFRRELARSSALQGVVSRNLHLRKNQLAISASCARYHLISPRLARWLLMSQDRAHADSFHMTHEFIAHMLGVRRVGITTAASSLQRRGLIKYHRGLLTVLDRRGLHGLASSCYDKDMQAYDAQSGSDPAPALQPQPFDSEQKRYGPMSMIEV